MKAIEAKKNRKYEEKASRTTLHPPSAVTSSFKGKGNRKMGNFSSCQGLQRVSLSAIGLQFCWVHGNQLPIIIYFSTSKGFFCFKSLLV